MFYTISEPAVPNFRKGRTILLAFLWGFGLTTGCMTLLTAGHSLDSLMRGVPFGSMSIVSVLVSLLLPALFSIFAFSFIQPWIFYLIAFFKSFLFGFLSFGLILSFGSSGWLWRFLIMLPDLLSLPLLFWFLRKKVTDSASALDSFLLISVLLFIGSIYIAYILPFMAGI